jgi:putative PIN family toxin of toxin-antitoxin system
VKVFLDTNVIVSAFGTRGLCADLFRLVITRYELIVSELVLEEAKRVLLDKFGLSSEDVQRIEAFLKSFRVVPTPTDTSGLPLDRLQDENDRKILAAAIEAEADVFVTGDGDLLALADQMTRPRIMDPRSFLESVLSD